MEARSSMNGHYQREQEAPDNDTYQPRSLYLDELVNDLSVATDEDSYVFPPSLKRHREEISAHMQPTQSNMQVPHDRDFQEYYPLEDGEDSFSELVHPEQNNMSDPRVASAFSESAAAAPRHYPAYPEYETHPILPGPETALFPQPVLDATYYPQAHAILYPEARATTHYHPEPQGGRYPMAGIDYPGVNDVMLGRGGATNQHLGNIRFRELVSQHKVAYVTAQKGEKPKIALTVVQAWRALDPPGRFLAKSDPSMGDDSFWHDVGDKEAKKKASQCLRERTPDIAPILEKLSREQVLIEEQKIKGSPERKPKAKETKPKEATAKKIKPTKTKEMPVVKEAPAIVASGLERSSARISAHSSSRSGARSSTESRKFRAKKKEPPSFAPPSKSGRVGPRLSLAKEKKVRNIREEKKIRHIREEVSHAIPSAASLVADAFDNSSEDGQHESIDSLSLHSLSLLPPDLRELMETSSLGNITDCMESISTDQSGTALESLSTSTWFRSVFENSNRTIPRNNSNRTMMSMSTAGSSLRGIAEESTDDMDESINALDLAFPVQQEFENRLALKTARNQISSFSLLSDLTGDSSHHRRQLMKAARQDSGYSMAASELTDMSDSLKGMDLAL